MLVYDLQFLLCLLWCYMFVFTLLLVFVVGCWRAGLLIITANAVWFYLVSSLVCAGCLVCLGRWCLAWCCLLVWIYYVGICFEVAWG